LLQYVGLGEGGLYYLHPLQAPLVLLQESLQPSDRGFWLYGTLYGALGCLLAYRWSQQSFYRFVVAAEGTR
jgi:fluoroquinolone transport system permease protein